MVARATYSVVVGGFNPCERIGAVRRGHSALASTIIGVWFVLGDEITDLDCVSPELLKALAIEPGDFKSTNEPTISQPQQPAV
jgi:hypothetical protein